jgi:tight adherence protein C
MNVLPLLIVAAVAGVVALAAGAYAAYSGSQGERSSADRLREMTTIDAGGQTIGPKSSRDPAMEALAERLAQLASSSDQEQQGLMRMRMVHGGFTHKSALEYYNGARVALSIGLPVALVPLLSGFLESWYHVAGAAIVFAALGYYVPVFWLDGQVSARQATLLKPFPDALDLLVSSVEAGLGLDAAFRRVADELETAAPELAREFQIVNAEINAGSTRIDALKHLSSRTGIDEIQALVNMLTQAERFGTSVARSLRVHSSLTRAKRMAKAEEEAAKVSPKLTIAMILFLLPCLFVILLGPAIVNIKNALFQ